MSLQTATRSQSDQTLLRSGFAVLLVWIGTLLATRFIPVEVQPEGALFIPAVIQSVALMLPAVWQFMTNWRRVLRAEYLLTVGLVFWLLLDMIQGRYALEGVSANDVHATFFAIGTMASAIWIGVIARPWALPGVLERSSTLSFKPKQTFRIILVLFVLGIFKYAQAVDFNVIRMFQYVGASRWATPWARGALGGWGSFIDHLVYFGYVVPALTVIYGSIAGWKGWRPVLCIILSIVLVLFAAQGGGRRIIGVMLGAALICWLLLQPRLRPRVAIGALISVIALTWTLQFMIENRTQGIASSQGLQVQSEDFHVDDNFYRLTQLISIFPEEHPYVHSKPIVFALVRPIPRVFWPGKPVNPGYDFAGLVTDQRVSLTTSVIGEFFAAWGWIAIFLGGYVYGRLGAMWNRFHATKRPYGILLYGTGALALFAGLRSMQDLVLMSYLILAWIAVAYVIRD